MTTLYDKLGRSEGIAALVDDIVDAHLRNPTIKAHFAPVAKDPERLEQLKKHVRDFLGNGSGGPQIYDGRNMTDAHRDMAIDADEYMAACEDIMKTLEAHDVADDARKDVLFIAWSLKDEIMHA